MRRVIDVVLLGALLVATVVWLGGDIARAENPFDPEDRAKPPWWVPWMPQMSGDDFGAVLRFIIPESYESGMPVLVGTTVAYAAYDVSGGGRIARIVIPEDLSELRGTTPPDVRRVPKGLRPSPDPGQIESATGVEPEVREYLAILSDETIERFEDEGRVTEYPMSVHAVRADQPESLVVLYRDWPARNIYVVAASLAPDEGVAP